MHYGGFTGGIVGAPNTKYTTEGLRSRSHYENLWKHIKTTGRYNKNFAGISWIGKARGVWKSTQSIVFVCVCVSVCVCVRVCPCGRLGVRVRLGPGGGARGP